MGDLSKSSHNTQRYFVIPQVCIISQAFLNTKPIFKHYYSKKAVSVELQLGKLSLGRCFSKADLVISGISISQDIIRNVNACASP